LSGKLNSFLAAINHPSIPRIYDYFSSGNRSYLTLEFINGKDMEAIINETHRLLNRGTCIGLGDRVVRGSSVLHAHKPDPIIFRDMKPSNVDG